MYLRIEYTEQADGICVCRCCGYEDRLVIPEEIEGKPVTALYDYALSGSRPRRQPQDVREAVIGEDEKGFADEQELSGEFLREVYLPRSLKRIGDYAFYLCRKLQAIHFQGDLEYMGGGAFVWCRLVSRLTFSNVSGEKHGVSGVLAEFTQELETEISYTDGVRLRLTFPEYYEESVENTPARIIDIHFHGSGYKYRQCFTGNRLNLRRYDELFPYAVANEFAPTCMAIAMNRLRTPRELSAHAAEEYRAYLREHAAELLPEYIRRDELEEIRFLAEEGLLGREVAEKGASLAAVRGAAEIGSYLMDYQREHFGPKRKTFEL